MTALILAAQRAIPPKLSDHAAGIREMFLAFNRRGFFSIGLCAVMVGSAVAYLCALAVLFHMGLQMQTASGEILRLQEDILKSEIALQESEAGFAVAHKSILDGMEKISSMSYIPREHTAALAHPQ